jgi:hypothetical protein
MMNTSRLLLAASLSLSLGAVSCSSKDEPPPPASCDTSAQSGCKIGEVCESVEGGTTACFAPVVVEGKVVKASDGTTGIGDARVVARDANGALVSLEVATSAADGTYKLTFPAARKADGTPTVGAFTLRADAAGYATFPSGLRSALPVDVTKVEKQPDNSYVVKNGTTTIGLDALPAATGLGVVSGTVKATNPGGTLVVAGGASGIAARDGTYVVFNVPVGAQEVRGYLAGLQLKPANATVAAGAEVKGIDLLSDSGALAVVSGGVEIVNASAKSTSIVLVVKSTFNTTLARGEVPRGLRAANVSGSYEIKDVPAGTYVVLGAFENDGLVRDPDTAIGGTAIQEITVANGPVTVPSFKITGALDVVSPGAAAPEPVTGTPTFVFKDDSSENGYHVVVYDTFGATVWENKDIPSVSGSADVSVPYGGPALKPGYYQFKALSWRDKKGGSGGRTYISATEDLKGVFIVQ